MIFTWYGQTLKTSLNREFRRTAFRKIFGLRGALPWTHSILQTHCTVFSFFEVLPVALKLWRVNACYACAITDLCLGAKLLCLYLS